MDPRLFTRRSSVAALATGVLVAVALGQIFGAPWGLAAITGLPAGATALGVSFGLRNGLFRARPRPWGPVPWAGAWWVGYFVATLPAVTVSAFLELSWETRSTIRLLLFLSGLAALMFGYIGRILEQSEAAEDAGEGPLRGVASPDRRAPSNVVVVAQQGLSASAGSAVPRGRARARPG